MAWTAVSIERHPELSNRKSQQEFLDEELRCNAYEVEQSKIVKGNYYALVTTSSWLPCLISIMMTFVITSLMNAVGRLFMTALLE